MSDVKATVQEVSAVEKRLEVEVPPQIVNDAFSQATRKIGQRAKIPGFRPGKIPANVLDKMYGPQIADEAALSVINSTYFEVIKKHDIKAVELPKIENGAIKRDEAFKYTAIVETIPPVALKKYRALDAKIDRMTVDEKAVDTTLNQLAESKAELAEVTDSRPIKEGDFVLIDLDAAGADGKPAPELSAKGFTVPLGGNVIFPEVEKALLGLKVGETGSATITIPDGAQNKKMAGKTFELKFTVNGLKEKKFPTVDDEFAKDLGEYDSLADLRAKIKADIEARVADQRERQQRERAIDSLIAANPVEVPAGLVARETDNLVHRAVHEYEQRGIDAKQLDSAMMVSQFQPLAERNIRTELLLDAIANQEKLTVDDAFINEFYEDEAKKRGATVEAVKRAYLQNGTDLNDRLRLERALKLIVSEAKWSEVEPPAVAPGSEAGNPEE